MARLRYSRRSRADLEQISDVIGADSPQNALDVLNRIFEKIEPLRSQPLIGHRRNDVSPGLRCLNSDGFVIYHRIRAGTVWISRIVHHSRELSPDDFEENE
jgi:plasmid stabilization system protein ParE